MLKIRTVTISAIFLGIFSLSAGAYALTAEGNERVQKEKCKQNPKCIPVKRHDHKGKFEGKHTHRGPNGTWVESHVHKPKQYKGRKFGFGFK